MMASQFEPFFERSRFGQQKKRSYAAPGADAPPAIKDSWREDFRFSDELAELERQQYLHQEDSELQQHFRHPPTYNVTDTPPARPTYPQARYPETAGPETQTLVEQYNQLLDAYQLQSQRLLALEEYVAGLQNENTELLHDNKLMARQIQAMFDDQAGETVEEEEELHRQAVQKARYQKIWGKLHLLL